LREHNVALGRYVLLPDHVHLFVCGGVAFKLSQWVGGLKRAMGLALSAQAEEAIWQPGFFDRLLRSDESYSSKWEYVRQNPVRHGLVARAGDWPYQGEFVRIDRA
jgi:REP element-mobilizing transposase RayT